MILKNKTKGTSVPFPFVLRVKPEAEKDFIDWLLTNETRPPIAEWEETDEYEFIEGYGEK